jgi:hypothetical protein
LKGTLLKEDWKFYHDALSLITAHETVEWMKKTKDSKSVTYYEQWILPVLGLLVAHQKTCHWTKVSTKIPTNRSIGTFPGLPISLWMTRRSSTCQHHYEKLPPTCVFLILKWVSVPAVNAYNKIV